MRPIGDDEIYTNNLAPPVRPPPPSSSGLSQPTNRKYNQNLPSLREHEDNLQSHEISEKNYVRDPEIGDGNRYSTISYAPNQSEQPSSLYNHNNSDLSRTKTLEPGSAQTQAPNATEISRPPPVMLGNTSRSGSKKRLSLFKRNDNTVTVAGTPYEDMSRSPQSPPIRNTVSLIPGLQRPSDSNLGYNYSTDHNGEPRSKEYEYGAAPPVLNVDVPVYSLRSSSIYSEAQNQADGMSKDQPREGDTGKNLDMKQPDFSKLSLGSYSSGAQDQQNGVSRRPSGSQSQFMPQGSYSGQPSYVDPGTGVDSQSRTLAPPRLNTSFSNTNLYGTNRSVDMSQAPSFQSQSQSQAGSIQSNGNGPPRISFHLNRSSGLFSPNDMFGNMSSRSSNSLNGSSLTSPQLNTNTVPPVPPVPVAYQNQQFQVQMPQNQQRQPSITSVGQPEDTRSNKASSVYSGSGLEEYGTILNQLNNSRSMSFTSSIGTNPISRKSSVVYQQPTTPNMGMARGNITDTASFKTPANQFVQPQHKMISPQSSFTSPTPSTGQLQYQSSQQFPTYSYPPTLHEEPSSVPVTPFIITKHHNLMEAPSFQKLPSPAHSFKHISPASSSAMMSVVSDYHSAISNDPYRYTNSPSHPPVPPLPADYMNSQPRDFKSPLPPSSVTSPDFTAPQQQHKKSLSRSLDSAASRPKTPSRNAPDIFPQTQLLEDDTRAIPLTTPIPSSGTITANNFRAEPVSNAGGEQLSRARNSSSSSAYHTHAPHKSVSSNGTGAVAAAVGAGAAMYSGNKHLSEASSDYNPYRIKSSSELSYNSDAARPPVVVSTITPGNPNIATQELGINNGNGSQQSQKFYEPAVHDHKRTPSRDMQSEHPSSRNSAMFTTPTNVHSQFPPPVSSFQSGNSGINNSHAIARSIDSTASSRVASANAAGFGSASLNSVKSEKPSTTTSFHATASEHASIVDGDIPSDHDVPPVPDFPGSATRRVYGQRRGSLSYSQSTSSSLFQYTPSVISSDQSSSLINFATPASNGFAVFPSETGAPSSNVSFTSINIPSAPPASHGPSVSRSFGDHRLSVGSSSSLRRPPKLVAVNKKLPTLPPPGTSDTVTANATNDDITPKAKAPSTGKYSTPSQTPPTPSPPPLPSLSADPYYTSAYGPPSAPLQKPTFSMHSSSAVPVTTSMSSPQIPVGYNAMPMSPAAPPPPQLQSQYQSQSQPQTKSYTQPQPQPPSQSQFQSQSQSQPDTRMLTSHPSVFMSESSSSLSSAPSAAVPPSLESPLSALLTINVYQVIHEYRPSLVDELLLRAGDQLVILQTFDDGWCLANLVALAGDPRDKLNTNRLVKGICPISCLSSKPVFRNVIPQPGQQQRTIR